MLKEIYSSIGNSQPLQFKKLFYHLSQLSEIELQILIGYETDEKSFSELAGMLNLNYREVENTYNNIIKYLKQL
ncbi:hypothetical protein [Streptococcus anginosus]|uniref:hypothetical protein n=1 Tax=Streptococcus anginosus TaxID=1328 RepID=UPI000814E3CE|nr:hypothetical protein [Streptococcus anginosus]ANW84562.1 hypothetical protein SanJ4206_0311c [Streptococcus anginosus]PRT65153.1 hypothetical protein C6A30_03750 [Streptococcus anginosus]PRT66762.1 hypothetical protein C6A28_09640 [Streptococcus anginosus]